MTGSSSKEMALEKIYQKKSQLEHILIRPDTYIGSVETLKEEMWVWDADAQRMKKREISFVPGLYKIFDEIIVNAADNKQRDPNMSMIRVNIDQDTNTIRIYNNGRGIPVAEHKEEKLLIPTMIFGHLLTSSNYNDDEKKVTGGRNGYGAKLCNIFSKKFVLETSSREYKKSFKQVWTDNMSKAEEPILKEAKEDDFTCITFQPDLAKFKMTRLDDDIVALMSRRAYDIAASTPGVKVYLNNQRVPVNKFEDYCKLYMTNEVDEFNNPIKLVYEKPHERWEIAVTCSDMGFQQVSFVNSIATTKGGRHVDYIVDQIVKHLTEIVNKKNKGTGVKPFQIKQHMWVFLNCLIENPTFDSQTKENMTLQAKSFGSKCQLTDDFFKKLTKCGLLDKIQTWLAFKERTDLEKAGSKSKVNKIKGIPKLDDANDAGTKDSMSCTLIVTEGDSAKTLAVAGLGVIGRDKYGVFPLRGKMLNVREATTKQILENAEVSNLLKIIGLNYKEKYESRESLKQLRYGKLMIMTDQDHDGSHIKGLLINFVHNQWPNLLKHGFVEEFITPIVKVSKGNQERAFYSMPEFEEWQNQTENWMTWKIKYYKGLGTSTSKEAKEYFSDFQRHRIKFEYSSARDDLAIQLAFSRRFIEERKDWLTRFMEERRTRRENHGSENYLYQKNTRSINYTEFVNKELVLFSNLDNERSIPSLVDGFKPGQRKVMFTCFKRNLVREIKVAQLAGSVAELSAYHHGEASLMSTIVNLAQNFVGSNNINLLLPIGQFGTRLHGGKDSASARYIFTALNPLTRLLFNPKDDPILSYINDDGLRVEPEWYIPIIPTVLVNGAEGIGTGWSTKVPNYNPREIIANIKRLINGSEPVPMRPFYKNFRGQIDQIDDIRVLTSGEVAVIGENTIEITELPIGVWTQHYKETVLEAFLYGQDDTPTCITDYKEYHTDTTVRFVVKMTPEQFTAAQRAGLHKFFKLQKTISLNSMVMFDENGCLRRYETATHVLREFYTLRSRMYARRKEYMEGMLGAESCKLDNMARFIMEKIENKIRVENVKKADIVKMLRERKYDPDPITRWKKKIARERGYDEDGAGSNAADTSADGEEEESGAESKREYDYLLSMPIWNLTTEKKDEILKQQRAKGDELARLKAKSADQLWLDDLDHFLVELDKYEAKEKEDENVAMSKAYKASLAAKGGASKAKALSKVDKQEYMPAPDGKRIDVQLDPTLLNKAEREAKTKEKKEMKKEAGGEVKTELSLVDLISDNGSKYDEQMIQEYLSALNKPQKGAKKEKAAPKVKEKKPKGEKGEKEEPVSGDDQVVAAKTTKTSAKTKSESTSPKTSKTVKKTDDKANTINNYFKKKPSKKSGSSDEEEEEESFSVKSDNDHDDDDDDEPMAKRAASARARKACNYNLGSDDETTTSSVDTLKNNKNKKKSYESDEDDIILEESEDSDDSDEFKLEKKKKQPTKQPSTAKLAAKPKDDVISLGDEESNDSGPKLLKKSASATALKKTEAAKKEPPAAKPKPAAKKPAAVVLDSEDEENEKPAKKPVETKTESKPVLKESTNTLLKMFQNAKTKTAPAAAAKTTTTAASKPKKKTYDDDDSMDDFVVSDVSDDESYRVEKKPTKKKLLDKMDSPAKRAKRTVVPKNQQLYDNDLFGESD